MATARKNKRHLIAIISIIVIGICILSAMTYHVYWVADNTMVDIEETIVIYTETPLEEE